MQKWLSTRLKELKAQFAGRDFTMEEVKNLMFRLHEDKEETVLVMLSELRKKGVLQVQLDPKDSRKRVYALTNLTSAPVSVQALTRSDLESLLKEAADLIRTRVDYSFILLLLFFKRMSDKWISDFDVAVEKARREYHLSDDEARKEATHTVYHDFAVSEQFLWQNIRKDPSKLAENFSLAMKDIAEKNPQLQDIFENFDFHQFAGSKENQEILRQLVELFSSRSLDSVAPDMLGDAYEWILRYFAPQKAKEGEIYTPREVIKLLIEFLDPKPGESVSDPAAGSGGMLIVSHQHVKEKYGSEQAKTLFLYGQEVNFRTRALAKMNLYLHDIRNAEYEYGDVILYPKFKDGDELRKFNVVVANPPWNQDAYNEEVVKRGDFWRQRFRYGFAPDQSADWLWIQHMLSSAKSETGRVGVVIDNGALFRGGKEKAIRQAIVEDDKIECIVLLPEKLFYNTGAPGSLIFLRHRKPASRQHKILFINASKEYEQHPHVRRLNRLNDSHIEKIVKGPNASEIEGFVRYVDTDEIAENDFNLNVTLYVYEHDVGEQVDIVKEWGTLKRLDKEIHDVNQQIESQLRSLGLNGP